MKIKLTTKVVISVFIINMSFIILLIPLLNYFNEKFTSTIIESSNETSIILRDNIQKGYRNMAMDNMKMLSTNTAYNIGQYLTAHPKLTKDDLMNNASFQKMSVRAFYHTGYTLVADPNDYSIIAHPEKKFVGKHLFDISDFSKSTYESIIKAFDSSKNQDGVPLVYEYANQGGDYMEKYAYISMIPVKTADGARLIVMATIFVDDYSGTAGSISKVIFQRTNENTTNVQSKSQWFVFTILLTALVVCIVSIILSMYFVKKYTNIISQLSNACKKIAEGDFNTKVESSKTNDEFEDLSLNIEYMRENINKQAEIIKNEIKKNDQKNRELGEALQMAEDKTKQLIDRNKDINDKI